MTDKRIAEIKARYKDTKGTLHEDIFDLLAAIDLLKEYIKTIEKNKKEDEVCHD